MRKIERIMLIDDDDATNFYHQAVIEGSDHCKNIIVFDNAEEALELIKNEITPIPTLIFLDINMPIMDGWEFLDAYQDIDKKRKSNIIIVMLTASLNDKDRIKSESYEDVSDFQHKPLSDSILTKISNIFEQNESDE